MNLDQFIKNIELFRQSSSDLTENKTPECLDPLLIYEQLLTALEELQVSEEELQQQNEELQIARSLIDQERQRYQDLFEFAPDSYIVTDVNGKIQEFNQAAIALLNVPREFLLDKPLAIFVDRLERSTFRLQLLRLQQGYGVQELEIRLQPRKAPS